LRVLLTRAAKADVKAAAEWYEQHRDGLGLEFTDRVLETIDSIAEHPLAHRKVIAEARRANLEQFPYALWYTVEPKDGSIVIGCLHAKRHPRIARERLLGSKWKGPEPS
jgi:toxin ParE1/3/4